MSEKARRERRLGMAENLLRAGRQRDAPPRCPDCRAAQGRRSAAFLFLSCWTTTRTLPELKVLAEHAYQQALPILMET